MIRDPFYGVPGLDAESLDEAARQLNTEFLADAWAYPIADRADLEARLRELFGTEAEIERAGSALCVRSELPPPERLAAIAKELATLDTRVLFVKAGERVEVLAFFQNPHGSGPRSSPRRIGREITGRDDVRAASSASCPCGAKHIAFTSRKAYGGQETEDIPIACLACGRSTLLVLGVAGGAEVYLADQLPFSRIRWLPAREEYAPSRADYPWWTRILASEWLPAVAGVVFGITLVLVLKGSLQGSGGEAAAGPEPTPSARSPRPSPGNAHLVVNDAGMTCNQRGCVQERLDELRRLADDAGATGFVTQLDQVKSKLDAGDCERALELARAIKDPEDKSFAATKVGIAHLSLDLVLDNHCRFLRARAPEPAEGQGGGSGSVGSELTED